ncbi:hypothetical protein OXIME_000708 [Oxyplasma meridianum]|uniref:Uncharacterized protein n=1 Tax=Oxyplasma meridianum TaxID=3073602 RepID=A0AAX4NH21_9ARCH
MFPNEFIWQVDQKYGNLSEEIKTFNMEKPGLFNKKKKEGMEIARRINLFKEWFKWFLAMNTVVLPEGYEVPAREFYIQMTLKIEAIPPYRPLHPKFLSIAALFTYEELSDLFGNIFSSKVQMLMRGR